MIHEIGTLLRLAIPFPFGALHNLFGVFKKAGHDHVEKDVPYRVSWPCSASGATRVGNTINEEVGVHHCILQNGQHMRCKAMQGEIRIYSWRYGMGKFSWDAQIKQHLGECLNVTIAWKERLSYDTVKGCPDIEKNDGRWGACSHCPVPKGLKHVMCCVRSLPLSSTKLE